MAIELQLEFTSSNFNNDRIVLTDTTGIDAGGVPNNGGYGLTAQADNESKIEVDAEIDGWTLTVTRPDATSFEVEIDDLQFDNFATDIELQIDDDESLQNGLWSFQLDVNEVGGAIDTITITQYIYDLDTVELAINAKFATDLDFCEGIKCDCNKSLTILFSYFRALKAAVEEQNTVQADYLSTVITTLLA